MKKYELFLWLALGLVAACDKAHIPPALSTNNVPHIDELPQPQTPSPDVLPPMTRYAGAGSEPLH